MVTPPTRLDAKHGAATAELAANLSGLTRTVPPEPRSLGYGAFGTKESATTFCIKESRSSREDADRPGRRVETDGHAERAAELLAAPGSGGGRPRMDNGDLLAKNH